MRLCLSYKTRMRPIMRLVGQADHVLAALAEGLRAAACDIETPSAQQAATVLVTWVGDVDVAIAASTRFAEAEDQARGRLVVHIWQVGAPGWLAKSHAATMDAWTRHTARDWAGRGVRVNGLTGPTGLAPADLAATIAALGRWPSMTGQVINLSLPSR